ncbi:MAG: hypothetical protein JXB10_10395 [Pirellulales bacterium]|nr:hypothetical protein [Pirellulales bacterium]
MIKRTFPKPRWPLYLLLLIAFLGGCDEDEQALQLAREAAARQAEQNREMARQNRRIAEATKELVVADARARGDLIGVQKDLRADQAEVGRQRDALENERQKIAQERHWDQLLAPALQDFGLLLAVAAALGFCGYLLFGLRKEDVTDQTLGEMLVQELAAEEPLLLPSPSSTPALKYPAQPVIGHAAEDVPGSET